MKIKNRKLLMTTAVTLFIFAMLLSSMIGAFGQTATKTRMNIATSRNPSIVGVGQQVLLQSWLRPYLSVDVGGYRQVNTGFQYIITKPDKTIDTITVDTNSYSEAILWYNNNTQLGTYSYRVYYPGDATQASVNASGSTWIVQSQATGTIIKAPTFARLTVKYPVMGLGYSQYIDGWINPNRESARIYFDMTYVITKPSGQVVTIKLDSHAEATSSTSVKVDELGTWSVKMSYNGDLLHDASVSPVTTWVVQQTQPPENVAPQQPLPDYAWQFPISAEYQEWYQIAGPWTTLRADGGRSGFNPYSVGPTSPHLLWKTQVVKGGIMGGDTGYMSWSGSFYPSSMGTTTVGAQGRIFFARIERYQNQTALIGTHWTIYCFDEYTGEEIFRKDLPGTVTTGIAGPMLYLDMSQQYKMDPSTRAAYSLWVWDGGLWQVDPFNGDVLYYNSQLANGTTPGGVGVYDGNMYIPNYPMAGNLTKWSFQSKSVVWTVAAPKNPWTGANILPQTSAEWLFNQDMTYSVATVGENPTVRKIYTWNLVDGSLLANGITVDTDFPSGGVNSVFQDGKIFGLNGNDMCEYAGDVLTGKTAWKSEPCIYPWGSFQAYQCAGSWGPTGGGGSQIYLPSWDGNLYCFNATTGKTIWKFFCGNTSETAMGHHMPWSEIITADNKVYFTVGEHTSPYPLPREGKFFCIDAKTGELIWSLDGWYDHVWDSRAMAGIMGGIIWYPNRYDGCLYGIGKGESATTVSAPTVSVPVGTGVLLQGTVTDQSPGAPGTPAVSDDSQDQWMGYLYMNKPKPTNASGVTVFLQAKTSDGSIIDITHVQSDSYGQYVYTWIPPAQDTYKIIASFEGSKSYFASSGECGLSVGPAAAVAPIVVPTPTPVSTASPIITPTVAPTPSPTTPQGPGGLPSSTVYAVSAAAIIIAIIAVAALVLRRRK
jgi:outer membrane protein assembly factor BamB